MWLGHSRIFTRIFKVENCLKCLQRVDDWLEWEGHRVKA